MHLSGQRNKKKKKWYLGNLLKTYLYLIVILSRVHFGRRITVTNLRATKYVHIIIVFRIFRLRQWCMIGIIQTYNMYRYLKSVSVSYISLRLNNMYYNISRVGEVQVSLSVHAYTKDRRNPHKSIAEEK